MNLRVEMAYQSASRLDGFNSYSQYSSAQSNNNSQYSSQLGQYNSPCPAPYNTLENEDKEVNGISKKVAFINKNREIQFTYEIQKEYNPHQIPPDWKVAERHSQARRVGIDKRPSKNIPNQYDICPCCNYQIQKDSINIMEDATILSFLGSGYPLFFNYMKYCILILIVIIFSSGAFNVISNFYGNSCTLKGEGSKPQSNEDDHLCKADWISIFSLANKNSKTAGIQDYLNFITIFILMILLIFFRKQQKDIDIQCDIKEVTPSDFTILVKDVPSNVNENELKEFFQSLQFQGDEAESIEVTEISYVYNTSHVDILHKNIDQIIQQKKKELSKLDPNSITFNEVAAEFDLKLIQEEEDIENEMKNVSKDSQKFSGYAFVSFETENQKQLILESAQKSLWEEIYESVFSQSSDFKSLNFKDSQIQVSESPEPLDIIWQNLTKKDGEKSRIRKFSFFLTIVLLCTCTYIIYLLTLYSEDVTPQQHHMIEEEQPKPEPSEIEKFLQDQYQSLVITLAIVCINSVIIQYVFRYLVTIESYDTYTLYNINLAQKLSLALFINSALVTCFINIVYTKNVFGKGGLIYTMFYYFAVDSLSSFISQLLDYNYYLKKFQKWWYEKKGNKCTLTQKEANELCQLPDHEIELCYAEIMNTMYITIFYSPAVPLGLFFSLAGISLYYWVQKYVVLKMKSVEKQISVKLSIEMTEYLEFIITIYAISNALFKWQTVDQLSLLQVVGALLGLLYSVLPMQLFVEKVFNFETQNESVTYSKAYPQFVTTYARSNPVTSVAFKQQSKKQQKEKQLQML